MAATTENLRYEVVEGWEQLPEGYHHADVVGVATDSHDRVFIYTRQESRVIIYNRDGTFVGSWGEKFFTRRTHGLTIAPDDSVYCVDEGKQVIYKFTPQGELLQTIGTPGVASDTGYDGRSLASITRGAPPFNRPTNVAIAPNGDLYVSDGYGNASVHHFSADGQLMKTWGAPGIGPGQFNLVHGVAVAADGRVLIADRENDRIQLFSPDGEYLEEWHDVQRPTNIAIDRDGLIYVAELLHRPGDQSPRLGEIEDERPGRVSVYDAAGTVLARWGGIDRCAPGNFVGPHDICVDSHGDLYVGEVTYTMGVRPGLVPDGCHTLQKFARVE